MVFTEISLEDRLGNVYTTIEQSTYVLKNCIGESTTSKLIRFNRPYILKSYFTNCVLPVPIAIMFAGIVLTYSKALNGGTEDEN